MANKQTLLWKYDFRHIGDLLFHIRESRNVRQTQVANMCKVKDSTIYRLENGKTINTRKTKAFKSYVEMLQESREFFPYQLEKEEADILDDFYDHSRKRDDLEHKLAAISLDTILPEHCPPQLNELVNILKQQNCPGFIMDPLWYTHALNGALLHLFDIAPHSEYLYRWEAWHPMATKFRRDSPVRQKHYDQTEYFPTLVDRFFRDKLIRPYLFTIQMRALIHRLHKLSEEHDSEFTAWWELATSFKLFHNKMNRNIWYQGQRIQTEIMYPGIDRVIEMTPGYPVKYELIIWEALDSEAEDAFKDIQELPNSHDIYYAARYDRKYNFHPNTWPEVKAWLSY